MSKCSALELACEIVHSQTPYEEAILNEIMDDIKQARCKLSPKEQQALPRVLDRASGSKWSSDEGGTPPDYASQSRCRAKLRTLLPQHDPRG